MRKTSMTLPALSPKQFRFSYFTPHYTETLAFYSRCLGFPVLDSWDRSPDDKGTVFGAASGRIEVLFHPLDPDSSDHLFDDRAPQGAFMVIEVEDVDSFHARVSGSGVAVEQALKDQSWGHRSFVVAEPNGLKLYFYSEL
jgi:uncharacterized glyoxalase superfamily protein PhnB